MKFNGACAILAVTLLLSVVKSQALDSGLDLLGPEIASTGFAAASSDLAIHSKNNASDSLSDADIDAAPQLASFSPSEAKQYRLKQLYDENVWKNSLVMWVVPEAWRDAMPHWAQSWFRCWVLAMALYLGVGTAWVYYTYFCFGDRLYPPGGIPTFMDILEQVKVAVLAMPLYAALPAVTEHMVERGWTRAYARVSDVGLVWYCIYFVLYMTSVEFFVYWQHRLLHDIKPGYRYLHYIHHKYNKEHTLSPFAGLAFHPIDGVWTTNIHDNIHGKVDPIMGAKYHTIHHTTYKHNYGHYFTYMDRLFGTLITPEEYESEKEAAHSKTS